MSNKQLKILVLSLILIIALLTTSCNLSTSITAFAVLDENATNSSETINTAQETAPTTGTTTAETNTTAEEKEKKEKETPAEKPEGKPAQPEKPEPNVPPVWKSDIEEFVLKGKTTIDLSQYFYDANNDSLAYLYTTPEKIEVEIDASVVTLTPKGHNFTTTISFTATDGEKATTKEITLIVPENTITINLEYKQGTTYDADNDGYEPTFGIIDLTVEDSLFSWDADETKLCTRWNVQPAESEESTTVCYGSAKCCNFVELAPLRDAWNEVFYSVYGQYGALLNNTISSQIIYADYELNVDEPFAEIYFSDWKELNANYYFASIDFENVCVETCTLTGFNETSYKLIFEIDGATLNLDKLTYSIVEEISNVLVNLAVKDNEGLASGSYQLYKNNEPVAIIEGFVEPDYYDIEVVPTENIVDKLVIENANLTKPLAASIGVDKVAREISIENVDVKKRYAVDLEQLEFEKAVLTATASANSLWKCRQWDYERELCFGSWEMVKELVPGQQYELALTKEDPGFIEGDVNITITPINITGLALAKDIPNITIIVNKNATIDLADYFANIEDAAFTYFEQEGISILFENGIATIIPSKDFAGTVYIYITATKGTDSAISNVFSVNVVNVTVDVTPAIILERKDFMLDEDVELDFEYLTKQELIEHEKWKEEYEVYEEETEKTEAELGLLKQKIDEDEKLLTEEEKAIKKQKKKWQKANDSIEAFVYDNAGNLKEISVEIEELREGKFEIKLPKQRSFKAGKYTIKLDLVKDSIAYSSQQDFTWGVLAINVNKSIYLPNEDAFIGIGVLDDAGKIVCNADVTLEITNPLNQKTILTTANNDIKISPECQVLGVTELPDYYTTYSVNGVGSYLMNLTAVTTNGVRSIQDNFSVQSAVEFDVARQGPTRVYPPVPYTMNISIIANQNYNGLINEYVPSSFEISEVGFIEVEEQPSGITLSAVEDSEINEDLISKIENNKEENKGFRGLLTLTSLGLDESPVFNYNTNKYINLCIEPENNECKGRVAQWREPLSGVRGDAGSIMVRKSRRAHTDLISDYEIEKEEKQAHNLDRVPVWRTGISHEFYLDSEIAESHTVSDKEESDYLNVSVYDNINENPITIENNNKKTTLNLKNNQNKIKNNIANFFTLIPSAQAQQITSPIITTINDTKIISIPVNLKKGSKYILSYKFDAPDISPEFYVLGPLEIGSFNEARQWQIASDAWTTSTCTLDAPISDPNVNTGGQFNILCTTGATGSGGGFVAIDIYARYCTTGPGCTPATTIPASNGLSTASTNPQNCGAGVCKGATAQFTFVINANTAGSYTVDCRCVGNNDINSADQDVTVSAADTTPPFFPTNSINNNAPKINEVVGIGQNATDVSSSISMVIFAHNQSGLMINVSNTSIIDTKSINYTPNITITLGEGSVIGYTFWANDTKGNKNTTDATEGFRTFTVAATPDTTPPFFPINSTNLTTVRINNVKAISQNVTDASNSVSLVQFFHNQSGTWRNVSNTSIIDTKSINYTVNLSITLARGNVIGFGFWANDTKGNVNTTDVYLITVEDTTPTFTLANNNTNAKKNEVVQLSALVNDADTLSMLIASWNCSSSAGTWINISNITLSNTANNYTVNVTNNLPRASTCGWLFYSNDSVVSTFTASTLNTFVIADTTPSFTLANNNTNAKKNEVVQLSTLVNDADTLSMVIASWNGTGTWSNVSNTTASSTSINYTVNLSHTLNRGDTIGWLFYSNDSVVSTFTASTLNTFVVADTTPTFILANNNTNARINDVVQLSALVNDADTLSMIIASWNGSSTGAWINVSNITLSNTANNYTVNVTVGLARGNTVGWIFYSNDSRVATFTASALNSFVVADTTPTFTLANNNTNPSLNDVVQLSALVNDADTLSMIIASWNGSSSGLWINVSNITLSNTANNYSVNVSVGLAGGNTIGWLFYGNDSIVSTFTASALNTFAVGDRIPPIVNTSLNKSLTSIFQNDVLNFSVNITDETGLSFCQIIINQSGPTAIEIINISLSGTSGSCYNVSKVTLPAGSVINYTIRVNDTSNNFRTNDTIITVASAATTPVVKLNNATFSVDPVAGGNSIILISFNVTDADGVSDINASKAVVNLTLGPPDIAQFRFNVSDQGGEFGTCFNHTQGTVMIINCTVIMRYYDNASSAWVINVSVQDLGGLVGRNDTVRFTYNSLAAFSLIARGVSEGANLNFTSSFLNDQNVLAKAPILLNNTGNNDFDQINITAAALIGLTTASETIAASQFAVNITNNTAGNGLALSTSPQAIPGIDSTANATLLHGPGISGDSVPYTGVADSRTKGNLSLYFWVDVPSSGLSAQTYNNTWNMTVVDLS